MLLNDKRIIPYSLNGIKKSTAYFYSCLLILLVIFINVNPIKSQYRPKWPSQALMREVFLLNLEDGYFACQVNDSTDFLQLFELNKLCDGKPNCFKGSDELSIELKCTDRNQCHPKQPACINGVCLDNLCYCNDGYGGKSCNLPDENECKYRPCDIFAHCTNTLGSFYCSCMPGYDGDGFTCHDINECDDPTLASYCVENAECCNLPGHFVCKCADGYQGNGTQSCTDINECLNSDSCGRGAICTNKLGSFECSCPVGYTGDATKECWDIDECKTNPCMNGTCHNLPGDYSCTCLNGFIGNPKPENGCIDVNECEAQKNICGTNSLCTNTEGSYFCSCPRGHTGDPRTGCVDIDECQLNSCGANTICVNSIGSFTCQCKENFSGDPYLSAGCSDINECNLDNICAPENSECLNTQGGYQCKCKYGYTGDPTKSCIDINECDSNPCGTNAICVNQDGNANGNGYYCKCPDKYIARGSPEYGCDKAECESDDNCVGNARCLNGFCYCPPPYLSDNDCNCPTGYVNDAYAGCLSREETRISYAECTDKVICAAGTVCYRGLCSRKDSCQNNQDCLDDSHCKLVNEEVGKQCVEPCDNMMCGPNSYCETVNHQPACHCNTSYSGNPNDLIFGCSPKGPPSFMVYCKTETDCDSKSVCKPNFAGAKICIDVCDHTMCGPNAFCRSVNKKAECYCANKHFTGNPYDLKQGCSLPASAHLCTNDEDCPIEKSCILTLEGVRNCIEVCKHHQCSEGAKCIVKNHRPLCECLQGFARVSSPGPNGSITGTCEAHVCESDVDCQHNEHCIVNHRGLLDCAPVCAEMQCGENAECISIAHQANCKCKDNYEGNAYDLIKGCQPTSYSCDGCKAREPRGCISSPDCGDAQECINGQCRFLCIKDSECIVGERCLDGFCVPIGSPIVINMPMDGEPFESDKTKNAGIDNNKYVTSSTPISTIHDQKIVQPNLEPSTFPNLKTDTGLPDTHKKTSQPSRPPVLDDNFNQELPEIDINRQPIDRERPDLSRPDLGRPDLNRPDLNRPDLGRPDLNRPDLSRPDLNRPDLSRPDLSRPDLSRPDLSRPNIDDKMITRPVDSSKPPKIENNINIVDQPDVDEYHPDLNRTIYEKEPHKVVPDRSKPSDDINRIKTQPGFKPEYKHPSVDEHTPIDKYPIDREKYPPSTDRDKYFTDREKYPTINEQKPPIDNHDDIYNPPEFKTKPDSRTPTDMYETRPDLKQPSFDQEMPEYKHPLTPKDQYQPPSTTHRKQKPTINDRKPPTAFEHDFEEIDNKRLNKPNLTDRYYPDNNRQQPTRPDLLHPHIKTDTPFIDNSGKIPPFKDSKQPTRPDITYPDNKQYIQPVTRTTESPAFSDVFQPTRATTSTIKTDKYLPPEIREPGDQDEYNPPDFHQPNSKQSPSIDYDKPREKQTEKPSLQPDLTLKDVIHKDTRPSTGDSQSQSKTDIHPESRHPVTGTTSSPKLFSTNRPDLKWPTRADSKKPNTASTNKPADSFDQFNKHQPVYIDQESRHPMTTPDSTRIEGLNKPSRTDIRTDQKAQTKTDQQPNYPVSTRPSIDSFTTPSIRHPTSKPHKSKDKPHHIGGFKDESINKPTSSRPFDKSTSKPIDSYRPQEFQTTTKQPFIDKKQSSIRPPTSQPNPFIETKPSLQPVDTETPIRQSERDKNKLPPVLDHSRTEFKEKSEEHQNNYSKPSSTATSTSSRPNVTPSSSRPSIKPDTRPDKDSRPNIKQDIKQTDNKQHIDKTKPDFSRQPSYNDYTTTRPETRKTTSSIFNQSTRTTEVKHSSMQDFTSRPPSIKTQTSSTSSNQQPTDYRQPSISTPTIYQQQPTLPPQTKTRPDLDTPSSTISKDHDQLQPTTGIVGEKCVNNYCVPFIDEGILQVPTNKSYQTSGGTSQSPYGDNRPIATITTTQESIHKPSLNDNNLPFRPIDRPTDMHPTLDHSNEQQPDRAINIQICVDGVCRDKVMSCFRDDDCPSDKTCDLDNKQCISPCFICGTNSECSAVDHKAICVCPKGTIGEAAEGCFAPPESTDPSTERTIPPVSHINVLCQSDGIQVGVKLGGYDGIVYVKGYSQEYECRRSVRNDERDIIDFKVMFGQCGLFHSNGEASFILVVQKHPKLVTYRARAYHIKCMYNTGERVVTLGFNVSMITTSGTIANTGPPPIASLSICTLDGNEVSSAEIGDDLLLKVNVQPDFIYGGFARSCIAKTMEEEGEFQYEVTDANGCATDPSIFNNWEYDQNKKSLVARFNAFKFPSSNNLRFQCNIRICFNNCPMASCEDTEAYGRRRRRRELDEKDEEDQSMTLTNSLGIDTFKEGQLREEIQVQSNAILTFEKREQASEPYGQQRSEELDHVCLPKLGLVLSMIITTLLAIVAVATAISCWLIAYRRKANHSHHPLEHPSEIPNPNNPLFSTPTPVPIEPIPDYYNH